MVIASSPKKVFWLLAGLSTAISLLLTLIVFTMMPLPSELFLGIATSLFSFATIPLFIMALKDFKHGLRRAYMLLCVGIVLYGIGQLQFPLFEIVDASLWVNSGAVVLPYILSISCLFFGMRRFGKLIGLKSLWLSPWLAYGTGIVIALLLGFLIQNEQAVILQLEFFLAVLLFFSAAIALRIRSVTAMRYHEALGFMVAGFSMLIFAAFHHAFFVLALPEDHWYTTSGFILWPSLVGAVLFMRVGYSFASIRLNKLTDATVAASPVNVITYVASFASNPMAIDTSLDTLRNITSAADIDDVGPNKQRDAALADLYKELEEYLVTHEPLQNFTKESLREMVRTRFQFDQNNKSTFWSLFSE